ncbi:TPA: glycosyltransferase family 2 protein [Yersinia enterocolitica]|uniref:Putative glycosyl transferase n=1 Tax=Yersinia enterocolitica TaxID=630 RepID=Q692L6_YEREN|nr:MULTISPECIES: glycosyltransferase family 2 protein [Yersinia]AAT91793.1 putative glycosyl transferase [Yersinia enterocolitica]AKF36271.1 glycosyltransferase [Yersinia enterocolitica]ALG47127.1 glycosyltransferase [Yersinia enterocolitica]EKN3402207.1 glycosyltransferase family 2 protein [Yersinia enterocolitica]EKN3445094.1 glycosyltransferase family 2 protein [Yersinia enterocolitica]
MNCNENDFEQTSVAVVIVNWNGGELLAKCLQKLSEQIFQPSEIILVDNNSSDGSIDLIPKELLSNLTILRMTENLGFAEGNNRAITLCSTDYIALLNPDAFPEKDWLEKLMVAARENPSIVIFGSKQLCYPDTNIIDGTGDVYHISGLAWRRGHGVKVQQGDHYSKEIFSPCAGAAMYKRSALAEVEGFDSDFFCYVEDVDLGFRLRLIGHKALYVDNAIVQHVGSGTSGGKHSDFSVYYGHRNLVWVYVKNMPISLLILSFPLHILLNLISIIKFGLDGKLSVILRSKRDAIKGLPRMIKKRKSIQKNRKIRPMSLLKILDYSIFRRER